MKNKYGPWCLVAGAAEGLGKAFSRSLAAKNMNLILVDQQKDSLNSLASQLETTFEIQVVTLHLDLASGDSVGLIMEAISRTACRLLIYNAAFSKVQKFMLNDPDMLDRYVDVNMRTPMQLIHAFCHLYLPLMEEARHLITSWPNLFIMS